MTYEEYIKEARVSDTHMGYNFLFALWSRYVRFSKCQQDINSLLVNYDTNYSDHESCIAISMSGRSSSPRVLPPCVHAVLLL